MAERGASQRRSVGESGFSRVSPIGIVSTPESYGAASSVGPVSPDRSGKDDRVVPKTPAPTAKMDPKIDLTSKENITLIRST